ncbi:S41 family peptidase, partial [Peptostreptococcaceae bacterium OttesenSCG-928-C18]|nr:S41 family peptidase [Peptostreptococcaceae bacterium OttesenSCG-928-C18]
SINSDNMVTFSNSDRTENFRKLNSLMDLINKNFLFDIDEENVKTSMFKGLFQGLDDPYSIYLDKDERAALMESTSGEYAGVGLQVSVTKDNFIQVISPIKGSPADKKGIKTGDLIIKIDGDIYSGDQLNDAVSVMKGDAGKDVTLSIRRPVSDGSYEEIDFVITREIITLNTVEYTTIEDIGYISISNFGDNTDSEFESAFENLKEKKVKGIVIDLRGNPGGLLNSTVAIADYILPEGIIVKTVDKNGKEEVKKSDANSQDMPLVVLVNKGSASASELLTGALQDYKKAVVVGTVTFGKGIVQSSIPLDSIGDDGAVNITVAEYFTPNNRKIHEVGVTPDNVIEMDEEIELGPNNVTNDIQLKKGLDILRGK